MKDIAAGAPRSYPGENLAKGWTDEDTRERQQAQAGQALLKLIELAFTRCSRRVLQALAIDLARVVIKDATLEDLRAQIIELEEAMEL